MTDPTHHTDPQISEIALQIARDEQARYYAEAYGFPEVKTRAMALEPARWILLAIERALHQGAQHAYEQVDRALNAEEQFDGSPPNSVAIRFLRSQKTTTAPTDRSARSCRRGP